MRNFLYIFLLTGLFLDFTVVCQTSDNLDLLCKTKFSRTNGAGDVWGVKINNTNYALVTLDGGLSIVDANNTMSPNETAHINYVNYLSDQEKLQVPDVETFTKNGVTYAYLATNNGVYTDGILVIIINVNKAITDGGLILIDPVNDTPNPDSVFAGKIVDFASINQSHTLTIAGGYLYVATVNQYLPVWDLNQNPTSPNYRGAITINTPYTEIHEMYVKSTGSNSSKIYAAGLRGGLHVIDLNLQNMSFTETTQMYDSDKADADLVNSTDPLFDFRFTHSAWPNADGSYIFTTDELSVWPSDNCIVNLSSDANLYIPPNVLRDAHRQGAFLRTWKTSKLGSALALKGGFYVPEGQQQGVTDLSLINNSMVPSSIHQMFGKGSGLYVTHYTQGLRLLDISDPENLVEVGYYDDYPELNVTCNDPYFFRRSIIEGSNVSNWYQGIYGVFPDPNSPGVVYAGGSDGFYIFDVLPIAAPTGFTLSGSVGEHPTLSWDASSAVGLTGYKLYQKWGSGSYFLLITLGRNTTSFTDLGVTIGSGGKFAPTTCYRVTAYNIIDRESAPSGQKCAVVGAVQKSGGSSDDEEVSYEFNLLQAYPNPFNPSTQISYSLAGDADVTLKVYDMLGIEVANLVNETQSAGNYEINFDAENLASGVYIYRVVVSKNGQVSFTDTKQMILMK